MTGKARACSVLLALLVTACSQKGAPPPAQQQADEQGPRLTLVETEYAEVPGWNGEDFADVLPAFLRSCGQIAKRDSTSAFGVDDRMGTVGDWKTICEDAAKIRPGNKIEAKYFFESRFVPYIARNNGDTTGLFTGYYEPELQGRWRPAGAFQVPIYSRPKDIVSVDLGDFRRELDGTHLAGRLEGEKLVPYYSRAEINAGALKGQELEIMWVSDPVEAFFLHIQGSGRVRFADGSYVRIGYAGRNGHRYTSIGRELVAMGAMRLNDVTAPAIRQWLNTYPARGAELMNRNESYVFFRVIEGEGPIGAQNIPLTPGRSLAVDRTFITLGTPIWLDTTDPTVKEGLIQRMVIAQDTGSAIKGPVRGDVFWGFGEMAALRAGLMKQSGNYYLLLPRASMRPVVN